MTISDAELAALTEQERAELLARLLVYASGSNQSGSSRNRVRFLVVVTTACLLLIGWTVLLAVTLPSHHTASRWDLTWVGFDVALIGCLARTAWLAYRRRYGVALWAVLTGTLLVCDAWFDSTTATGLELVGSIAAAVVAELPLTALLFYVAHRVQVDEVGERVGGSPLRERAGG